MMKHYIGTHIGVKMVEKCWKDWKRILLISVDIAIPLLGVVFFPYGWSGDISSRTFHREKWELVTWPLWQLWCPWHHKWHLSSHVRESVTRIMPCKCALRIIAHCESASVIPAYCFRFWYMQLVTSNKVRTKHPTYDFRHTTGQFECGLLISVKECSVLLGMLVTQHMPARPQIDKWRWFLRTALEDWIAYGNNNFTYRFENTLLVLILIISLVEIEIMVWIWFLLIHSRAEKNYQTNKPTGPTSSMLPPYCLWPDRRVRSSRRMGMKWNEM